MTTDDVSQAHHHAARTPSTSSTPSTSQLRKLVPSGNLLGMDAKKIKYAEQDHARLHEGRGGGQEDRRPGHGAQEGLLPRGPELDQVRLGADPVDHPHPHHLQRRHPRHPAGPHQAADQLVGGAAEPRVQGQGLDPQHPLHRHHGRGDGRRGHGQAQVHGQGQHDQGRDRPDDQGPDRGQEGRPVPRLLEGLQREREPDGVRRDGHPVDVVARRDEGALAWASPAPTSR